MLFRLFSGRQQRSGFTLIEVLVTAALITVVFGGLFACVRLTIVIIQESKAKAGATALAVETIEYARSLPYTAVGTTGGPVYGEFLETRTVSLNDIEYTERIAIRYEDDPADGLGYANDVNTVIEDYKKFLVEYTWMSRGEEKSLSVSTNIVPNGVETTVGGGTLRIVVQDKSLNPVPNAQVTIVNMSLATTTNTTQYTNAEGVLLLSGIPAGTGYNVSVTKPGYSSDYTVEPSAANPNPFNRPLTVADAAVTTKYFTIDQLGDILVTTRGPSTDETFEDSFDDTSGIATSDHITVAGGEVSPEALGGGQYYTDASFMSVPIGNNALEWNFIEFEMANFGPSSVLVRLYYDDNGTPTLLPESVLPGNAAGFDTSTVWIDLSAVDANVYPSLRYGVEFHSPDSWSVSRFKYVLVDYRESGTPVTDVDIEIRGDKLLGNDPDPVYKYEVSMTTDGAGEIDLADIEWDVYHFLPEAYRLVEICPSPTMTLDPNESVIAHLALRPVEVGLRVTVIDPNGAPIENARLDLYDYAGPYSDQKYTSSCGQVYFSASEGLTAGNTYAINVYADGYLGFVEYPVVSNGSEIVLQLNLE